MSQYLFDIPEVCVVPVKGEEKTYPVHRIFCVGRNYAEHAAEMGNEVDREAPFYFLKSLHAVRPSGSTIPYPPGTKNFHHEMELVIAIGKPVFKVATQDALSAVYGYACGLDMTRRDLQIAERKKQRPWDLGKNFENGAILSAITKAENFGPIGDHTIALGVNGELRQSGRLSDMVWKVEEIISHLSGFYHLCPGDLIMTGTPAGVGPVTAGDVITGSIEGLDPISLTISEAE